MNGHLSVRQVALLAECGTSTVTQYAKRGVLKWTHRSRVQGYQFDARYVARVLPIFRCMIALHRVNRTPPRQLHTKTSNTEIGAHGVFAV